MPFIQRFILVVLMTIALNDKLLAQSETNALPNLLSPMAVSPNSASLGKFGEIPVGYYTGIPNINIPLYEINTGGLKVPITLDYHAGGVKVEDIASWVGLGWALNAGGMITRQVRCLPDDSGPFGFLISHDSITKYLNGTMSNLLTYFENVADQGMMDSEQDLFIYNFGGSSGKFIFDTSGSCVTIPTSKYKIEFGSFLGKDRVFKITDLSGNQYFFTDMEMTDYGYSVNNAASQSVYDAISSWYLTQINNVLNTDSITFRYAPVINNIQTLGTQTKYLNLGGCQPNPNFIATGSNLVHGLVMTSIHFKNGTITLNCNAQNRCDIISDKSLSSIIIQNTDSSFYKKFTFYQTYSSLSSFPTTTCDPSHPENARLYLDSLSFSDKYNIIGKYKFNYLSRDLLPSRLSFSQDLWGYFNGQTNSTLIPNTLLLNTAAFGPVYFVAGANRDADFTYAKAGTLNSIVYPTGGRTEFEYEPNTVNNLAPTQGTTVSDEHFLFYPSDFLPRITDTTFELTDDNGVGGVLMNWTYNTLPGCGGVQSVGCPVTTITDATGVTLSITGNGSHIISKGTVHVKLDLRSLIDDNVDTTALHNYYLNLTWKRTSSNVDTLRYNAPVGGLRIKKMTSFTAGDSIASVRKYTYNTPDSTNYSSGTLLSYPNYISSTAIYGNDYTCNAITISSTSNATLATDQSSYTTYKYVQELLGKNGEFGKNEYQFTSADQYPDIIGSIRPFPPAVARDWKRGKLVGEKNFRYNNQSGQYELVKETIHNYLPFTTNIYNNLKIGKHITGYIPYTHLVLDYDVAQYSMEVGWSPLTSETTRIYDQTDLTKYQQTTNTYTYSNTHYQPITVTTTNSKGEVSVTQNKYPLDYPNLTANDNFTSGILNLQNKNVVTPVIEKYTQLQNPDGSNNRTISALISSYRPDRALTDTIWAAEFTAPSTSFTPTSVSGGRVIKNSSYQPQIEMLKYDPTGNIIEQRKMADAKHTYIWDYHSSYPVAEVVNADSASIAYTSFEAEGAGHWVIPDTVRNRTDHFTGNISYDLHGAISKTGLNTAVTYVVSYWSKNGSLTINGTSGTSGTVAGVWTYFEHRVMGSSTISVTGNATIDELRLFPTGALMTTYTFNPIVGISSQCSSTNYVTYYSYDTMGRLYAIRDMRGNIIKTINYHYQQ